MRRSMTSGRKIESMNERWLLARMTGPLTGIFSSPTIQGRNTVFKIGPAIRFFIIQ
jgi:hypothetical protein